MPRAGFSDGCDSTPPAATLKRCAGPVDRLGPVFAIRARGPPVRGMSCSRARLTPRGVRQLGPQLRKLRGVLAVFAWALQLLDISYSNSSSTCTPGSRTGNALFSLGTTVLISFWRSESMSRFEALACNITALISRLGSGAGTSSA